MKKSQSLLELSVRNKIASTPQKEDTGKLKKLKVEKAESPDDEEVEEEKVTYGHYRFGDKPDQILKAKKNGDSVVFTIQWKPRSKGGRPPNQTEMTNFELRKYDKDLLLDYYETKLQFSRAGSQKSSVNKSAQKNFSDRKQRNREKGLDIDQENDGEETYKEPEENKEVAASKAKEIEIEDEEQSQAQHEGGKPKEQESEKVYEEEHGKEEKDGNEGMREEEEEEEKREGAAPLSEDKSKDFQKDKSEPEQEQAGNEEIVEDTEERVPLSIGNDEEEIIIEEKAPQEALGADDIVTSYGQPSFADVGSNMAEEIRDLTLDPNMRIYSQKYQDLSKPSKEEGTGVLEKPKPQEESEEDVFEIESPKELSDTNSVKDNHI